MLNPNLKLNQKLFDKDVEVEPTRAGFGTGLLHLGEVNPNVVALSADLTESTQVNKFAEKFPERFFEIGVAEQNMAAVAAGLATSGKVAFISSYATFSPGKNWETIRTTAVYNEANVKIAGHHSGIMTGPDGATHQATEDIAITRCWPKMHVYVPCDSIEAKKATIASANITTAVYLRYTRDKTPIITTDETPFIVGKVQPFWINENPKVTIFATGYMLYYALLAAKELEEEKLPVLVVNVATIKPLEQEGILEATRISQAVVTVEDHQVEGGMGSTIAELLAKTTPLPIEFIGLQDTFAESGRPIELIEKYGLGTKSIKEAVKRVIRRKI
ncbi:MAG TPA: transketolase C-terminal domain-containing protein [Candidatus Sulfotelmatobacter sp.]|jgi:transketolase|nr:transketolase C-terminal domain-containing protein [Candidatus Sulfotelmatobacter sp.]